MDPRSALKSIEVAALMSIIKEVENLLTGGQSVHGIPGQRAINDYSRNLKQRIDRHLTSDKQPDQTHDNANHEANTTTEVTTDEDEPGA